MNKEIIKYAFLMVLFIVLQEMIFNHINLFGFVNPMIYVAFIFVFPVYKDKTWLLLTAFILGISIDMITNDGGIHAFSLVFVAYYRLLILRFIKGTHFSEEETINIKHLDSAVQVIWILIIVFIHSFIVFFLEQFSFNRFGNVLLKTFSTTIFSTLLIIIGMQLFTKKESNAW